MYTYGSFNKKEPDILGFFLKKNILINYFIWNYLNLDPVANSRLRKESLCFPLGLASFTKHFSIDSRCCRSWTFLSRSSPARCYINILQFRVYKLYEHRSMSNEQWALSIEQWALSNAHRAMSIEQWALSNELRAMRCEQWALSNVHWAISIEQWSMSYNELKAMRCELWAKSYELWAWAPWAVISELLAIIYELWAISPPII